MSTPVADTESFEGLIRVGRSADEIAAHLRAALAEGSDQAAQRVRFARANIKFGGDFRVVSGGRANDFAVVEMRRENTLIRIRTSRKVRDVAVLLDRLGVAWDHLVQLLQWASGSDALDAQVVEHSEERD